MCQLRAAMATEELIRLRKSSRYLVAFSGVLLTDVQTECIAGLCCRNPSKLLFLGSNNMQQIV